MLNDMKKDWRRFMSKPSNQVTPENHFDSLLEYLKREESILEHASSVKIGGTMRRSCASSSKNQSLARGREPPSKSWERAGDVSCVTRRIRIAKTFTYLGMEIASRGAPQTTISFSVQGGFLRVKEPGRWETQHRKAKDGMKSQGGLY